MIRIENLSRIFGSFTAVDNISGVVFWYPSRRILRGEGYSSFESIRCAEWARMRSI